VSPIGRSKLFFWEIRYISCLGVGHKILIICTTEAWLHHGPWGPKKRCYLGQRRASLILSEEYDHLLKNKIPWNRKNNVWTCWGDVEEKCIFSAELHCSADLTRFFPQFLDLPEPSLWGEEYWYFWVTHTITQMYQIKLTHGGIVPNTLKAFYFGLNYKTVWRVLLHVWYVHKKGLIEQRLGFSVNFRLDP